MKAFYYNVSRKHLLYVFKKTFLSFAIFIFKPISKQPCGYILCLYGNAKYGT